MPFRDKDHILRSHLFKIDPNPIELFLGAEPKSVVILRTLTKYLALLAAGVVIATSIVLKDLPLIGLNLLLTLVVLFYQFYKVIADKEERGRFLIELLLILGAAGLAIWIAYPLFIAGPITYLTILIFANYIATVINIASYFSTFFSPMMVGGLIGLRIMQEPDRSKFAIEEKINEGAVLKIQLEYKKNIPFKPKEKETLIGNVNNSILWLNRKLIKTQRHVLSSEIYAGKIATLKNTIRNVREGNLSDLLTMFKTKRLNRATKIIKARRRLNEFNEFSNELDREIEISTKNLKEFNKFLRQYTHLAPVSHQKDKQGTIQEIQRKKHQVIAALNEARTYHIQKFNIFDQYLRAFSEIEIGGPPVPTLEEILQVEAQELKTQL